MLSLIQIILLFRLIITRHNSAERNNKVTLSFWKVVFSLTTTSVGSQRYCRYNFMLHLPTG